LSTGVQRCRIFFSTNDFCVRPTNWSVTPTVVGTNLALALGVYAEGRVRRSVRPEA